MDLELQILRSGFTDSTFRFGAKDVGMIHRVLYERSKAGSCEPFFAYTRRERRGSTGRRLTQVKVLRAHRRGEVEVEWTGETREWAARLLSDSTSSQPLRIISRRVLIA